MKSGQGSSWPEVRQTLTFALSALMAILAVTAGWIKLEQRTAESSANIAALDKRADQLERRIERLEDK